MHIHEQHMSCNMSHKSIDENNNSLRAPFKIMAVRESKAQNYHAFTEQHLFI
jgi:hypothetical protein